MKAIRTIAVVGMLAASVPAMAAGDTCSTGDGWRDPLHLYGDEMRFRVLRDGDDVGFHRVAFKSAGEALTVESEFSVEVKVLFFTAYSYRYTSTDVWRNSCLVSVDATVDDNGERSSVRAEATERGLTIVGPSGVEVGEAGLFPSNHWHAGVIGAERVLNTITGTVSEVDIVDDGDDWVVVNGELHPVRRYHYTGDLRNTVWYDRDGRWVKMQFSAEDGSTIEYVCEQCRRVPSREPA